MGRKVGAAGGSPASTDEPYACHSSPLAGRFVCGDNLEAFPCKYLYCSPEVSDPMELWVLGKSLCFSKDLVLDTYREHDRNILCDLYVVPYLCPGGCIPAGWEQE